MHRSAKDLNSFKFGDSRRQDIYKLSECEQGNAHRL